MPASDQHDQAAPEDRQPAVDVAGVRLHLVAEATLPACPSGARRSSSTPTGPAADRGQFPDLADAPLRSSTRAGTRPCGAWTGAGRSASRGGDRHPGVRRELAVLPGLDLPLPIPRPVFVGAPPGLPVAVVRRPVPAGREPFGLSETQRRRAGTPARRRFLRALHAHSGEGLPEDPFGRGDMAKRVRMARERLGELGWPVPEDLCRRRARAPAAAGERAHPRRPAPAPSAGRRRRPGGRRDRFGRRVPGRPGDRPRAVLVPAPARRPRRVPGRLR